MRKAWAWILPVMAVAVALFVVYFLDTGDGVPYTASSTGERGASLFFDTLRHMGHRVRVSRRPLTAQTSTNYVYILIQPRTPHVSAEVAAEMLEWVERGGRLIFLCRRHPNTVISRALNAEGRETGGLRIYTYGSGEIITGRARAFTNGVLMGNPSYGEAINAALIRWRNENAAAQSIFFAEYDHGFHSPETFVGRLPLVIQLMLAQLVAFAVVGIWHLGKRFGNAVPAYEEVEREENEYVRSLARLYMESGIPRDKRMNP